MVFILGTGVLWQKWWHRLASRGNDRRLLVKELDVYSRKARQRIKIDAKMMRPWALFRNSWSV